MIKLFLYITLFVLIYKSVDADDGVKKISMKNIKGDYVGGKNMSIEEIEKRAIDNAKVNALQEAGIEENITSYQSLFKNETSKNFDEIYTSDILADIQGSVIDIELVSDPVKEPTKDGLKVTVIINCTVVKYEILKDIEFDAEIDGIKNVYVSDSTMSFSIKPTKDCYIKIFWIANKSESNILFPNENDKNNIFLKSHLYKFPEGTSYVVDTKLQMETIRLLFVLLKKDVLFKDIKKPMKLKDEKGNTLLPEVNYSNITNWLYSIPPFDRKIISKSFTIVK